MSGGRRTSPPSSVFIVSPSSSVTHMAEAAKLRKLTYFTQEKYTGTWVVRKPVKESSTMSASDTCEGGRGAAEAAVSRVLLGVMGGSGGASRHAPGQRSAQPTMALEAKAIRGRAL